MFAIDWDNFVWIAIRSWEQFYLDWLTEGRELMLIYYEKLISDELKSTLVDTILSMNLTIDSERLECAIKHSEGIFPRIEKCLSKESKKQKCNENEYIYSRKHIMWVNAAIRKVRRKVKKRGLDTSSISKYENTNIKLKYCL